MVLPSSNTVDLRAKRVNVKVMHGDAWAIKVILTDVDLREYDIVGTVYPGDGGATVPLTITSNATDLEQGIFYYGQTEALILGAYDVQVSTPGGLPRTYVKGRLSVERT